MKKAYIIHGAYGHPDENWIPWLKDSLIEKGYRVFVPTFPTPENQNLEKWMNIISPNFPEFDEETILVGHSIGATFILSVLERLPTKVGKVALVSGFFGALGNDQFDQINKTFAEKDFNWSLIKSNSIELHMFHGGNDPYVPMSNANSLGKKLGTRPILLKEGGHLNTDAGFKTFESLLSILT